MKLGSLPRSDKFKLCALALALVAGSNVCADTTTSGVINPGSATDKTTGSTPTAGAAGTGNFTIKKYNDGGVLIGANVSATFAPESISFSSNGSNDAKGSAYGVGTLKLSAATNFIGSATSSTVTAEGVRHEHPKAGTIASYTVAGSATTQAQLNAMYGSGTVAGSVSEKLYSNLTSQNGENKSMTVDNAASRAANVTYSYTSLNHANGAFGNSLIGNTSNTLNYNFGSFAAGANPGAYGFDLYNLIGSYGLRVVSITPTGNSGIFSLTGLDGTTNLAADGHVHGTVTMAAQTAADHYAGSWSIVVGDSSAGLGAGKISNYETLTVNVQGTVTAVPEPESYAMLLAGLGLIGTIAIRRRNQNNG